MFVIISHSPAETLRLAERFGRAMNRGIVIALYGELGSGKTVFAQGLAKGLDVPADEYVRSPSFTLINEYGGRLAVYHFDAFRLPAKGDENSLSEEMHRLGYEEYFDSKGIVIIEWADKIEEYLPEEYAKVTLEHLGGDNRKITFEVVGDLDLEFADVLRGAVERPVPSPDVEGL